MAGTIRSRFLLPLALLIAAVANPVTAASAAPYKALYSVCSPSPCANPQPLDAVADASGTVYGVTHYGGEEGVGTLFALVPNARKTKWKYKLVQSFCQGDGCDGSFPNGGLIVDVAGNVYGTTMLGGAHGQGIFYRFSRKGGKWVQTRLYDFCAAPQCADVSPAIRMTYAGAASGAPYDGVSPLYGVFSRTPNNIRGAAAFSLTPQGDGKPWAWKKLHDFCRTKNCPNGAEPVSIMADASGNLFGATSDGGTGNAGTVFALSPSGGKWSETILHSFCASCTNDGAQPMGQIAVDGAGNVYGATMLGGANGQGMIFKLATGDGTETDLYDFCPGGDCTVSGATPTAGVVLGGDGTVYGATALSGPNHNGALFALNPQFGVVHAFASSRGDGALPISLSVDGQGNLSGVTSDGGSTGLGAVFGYFP